jgi:RNA polymerase sigma factor (sigma-70 family)
MSLIGGTGQPGGPPKNIFRRPQYLPAPFVLTGMDTLLPPPTPYALPLSMAERNHQLTETIVRERGRLGSFIRRRVADAGEAEDILQDVFFELVEAYRLPEPIEQVGAWLLRVARNRIVDRFRKKREEPLPIARDEVGEGDDETWLERALPDPEGGPEAAYRRAVLLEAIALALDELPAGPRDVFIAHELEGRSFKALAEESGVRLNTLLGWKRQAVLHLRSRLLAIDDELNF